MDPIDFCIQWIDHHLTNLDFAGDIALLAAKTKAMQHMTENLQDGREKVKLRISTQKTKILKMGKSDDVAVLINNQLLKEVDPFQYLGSILSSDDGVERDFASHIGKAASVFHSFQPVWSATALRRTTKLHSQPYMPVRCGKAQQTWHKS